MRFVCKKCGRFVSQNAEVCKCCGTKNPAIPQETKQNNHEDDKCIKCPDCGYVFSAESMIKEKIVICPNCSCSIQNPYHKNVSTNAKIFIVLFILFTIGYAVQDLSKSPREKTTYNTESYNYASSDYASTPSYNTERTTSPITENSGQETTAQALIFTVNGSYDPEYIWVITSRNNELKFEYIIKDSFSDRQIVKSSGSCIKITFNQLKQRIPGAVIRECPVLRTGQKLFLLGPIETHYNIDGREQPVYGIIVMSNQKDAQLFLNDTDNFNEFIPMDRLTLEIR